MENNHEVTNEELARMIAKGFEGVDERFNGVDRRFDKVEERLDRIEHELIADHRRRIEKLEDQVGELRDLLAVKT
jgi:hypothetical protein